jgi:hypothetical protein
MLSDMGPRPAISDPEMPEQAIFDDVAAKGNLSEEAGSLVKFRGATLLGIESADEFFQSLGEKLDSLETPDAPHPLSAALAVTSLKRYLGEQIVLRPPLKS